MKKYEKTELKKIVLDLGAIKNHSYKKLELCCKEFLDRAIRRIDRLVEESD